MAEDASLGTVVICTAIGSEYTAVREHLADPLVEHESKGTLYEVGTFAGRAGIWRVALAEIGIGNTTAGIELERAISAFSPQVVLFVGVAGGRKDVALGDVVAADAIYDYDAGKDTADAYLPRFKTHAPSHRMVQRAKAVARHGKWQRRILPDNGQSPQAIVKPLAAGGTVVADRRSNTARRLDQSCGDAVGVDMEGHGFLHGAYVNAGVDALVIRGISDLLTDKTGLTDRHWQPLAARHAAAFAFEILTHHTPLAAPQSMAPDLGQPTSSITMTATPSDHGRVYQSGHDQYITEA
ncbi:phosphorylase family protein [Amycolatopsis sp. w19]|uniref:5'-methylthioadenosine/S-adenosylhomocysteine nucleosidase family protein n=1 Tax=Amycolatopsis sp. w19 TaxID=3448134 RepID=UPI003F1B3F7A